MFGPRVCWNIIGVRCQSCGCNRLIRSFASQVHLLHRAVPDGRGRGAAHHLRRAAVRAEDGLVLSHAPQQVQLLLRLPHLPHPRHDLLHPA